MVDLHRHHPMHLLARAPRDVVRGMARVRARPRWLERLRAFVLLLAARLLDFRAWDDLRAIDPDGARQSSSGPPPDPDEETLAESVAVIRRHVGAIAEAASLDHVAIGSDLDGFIRPTAGGVQEAADLAALRDALRAEYGATTPRSSSAPTRSGCCAVLPAGEPEVAAPS